MSIDKLVNLWRYYKATREPEPPPEPPPPPPEEPPIEPPPIEPPPVEPPPIEPPVDPLRDAIIASNSAQGIADFPETSRIVSVEITEQEICIEHTKRGLWEKWYSPTAESLVEGSVWIFAEIDGALHGGTYESKRPNQRCKALTPEKYGGTVATRLSGHIKQGPLRNWVPKAGETVWFVESTPARNRDERIYPGERGRSDMFEMTWPDFGETEEPPSEPYRWNMADQKAVNTPEFIGAITAHGPGAENLMGADAVKRRFDPDATKGNGVIWEENGTLRGTYTGMPGWPEDGGGRYAWLNFVMGGESMSITGLWRRDESSAFFRKDIWEMVEKKFGTLPAPGSLGAWWISGANIARRTDLHPWRR